MKDLQFFDPNECLAFDEKPALSVPDFDKVPSTEFTLYRSVSRSFPQCLTFATFTMIQKTKSNSCKTSGRVTKVECLNFHLLR